jgi:hypothetical protein
LPFAVDTVDVLELVALGSISSGHANLGGAVLGEEALP